jgi:hypothetical protein
MISFTGGGFMSGDIRTFLESSVEQGDAVREMTKSQGWKIIEQWINGMVTSKTLQLLDCSLDEVHEKRAEIRTLRSIISRVRDCLQYAGEAEKELRRFEV